MAERNSSLFDDAMASPEGNESSGPCGPQSTAGPQGDSTERQHIRLACQACQRKKIKCDRFFPCGQCTRSNLQCVASTRKPRAKHSGKRTLDAELRNRIAKLENLVETLSGEVATGTSTSNAVSPDRDDTTAEPATEQPTRKPSVAVEKYLGREFWSSLTSEFQALRDALEEDQGEGEEDETTPSTSSSGPSSSAEYDLLICPPGVIYVMPGALNEPGRELSQQLCSIFCTSFDELFRMFHQPSLRRFMIDGGSYLGQEHNTLGNKAVKAAVWYAAVNTMSEKECLSILGQSRPDAHQHYKRIVDVALAQADLMNTTDVATLQAFITYLSATRVADVGRRMWTLMAIAVRIAKAMGLHREGVPRSPFMTELRRRLFHQIRLLDAYSSIDRGSEGLIAPGSFDTPFPNNVDDSEFDEDSAFIPHHDKKLTDESFALMAYAATEQTGLLFIPEGKTGATWQDRLQMAEEFEHELHDKYISLCDMTKPYHRMMSHVADGMATGMKLRAVRPIQKHASSMPPRVDSPFVLKLAMDSLLASEAILTDPETSKLTWMIWVPWHGLAVALAGLCSIRDTALATKAWQAVEASYARNLRFVAEGRHGMLWRPIEKLYRKASAFRDHREASPASATTSPQPGAGGQLPLPQMGVAYPVNTGSTSNVVPPAHSQVPPSAMTTERNHNNLPHGGMPTSGVSMDFDFSDINLNDTTDLPNNPTTAPSNLDANNTGLDVSMMNMMDLDPSLDFNGPTDLNWMDFERILEDMNAVGGQQQPGAQDVGAVRLGDVQWPSNVPADGSWPCNLRGELM